MRNQALPPQRVDHRFEVVGRRLPRSELQQHHLGRDNRDAVNDPAVSRGKPTLLVNDEPGSLRTIPTRARDLDHVRTPTRHAVDDRRGAMGDGRFGPARPCCTQCVAFPRLWHSGKTPDARMNMRPHLLPSSLNLARRKPTITRHRHRDVAVRVHRGQREKLVCLTPHRNTMPHG